MFSSGHMGWTAHDAQPTHICAEARHCDVSTGFVGGTKVATSFGWRAIEAIAVGDKVLTFDDGLQPVTAVERQTLRFDRRGDQAARWPLLVPEHALGNRDDMILMPRQAIMVESDAAEDMFGDPFAVIPALALDGHRGIRRTIPGARIDVVHLAFERDQVVFANAGALFLCPANTDLLTAPAPTYSVLSLEAADALVNRMEREDRRHHTHSANPQTRVA